MPSAPCWRPLFDGRAPDTTEENIQSRIRGLILMALSNKFGHMVIATGNKSEMSVGYATLYGDMNGGYNVLKDVYKMDVFALSRWRNRGQLRHRSGPQGPRHAGQRHHPSAVAPNCAPTRRTRIRCRPTKSSTAFWSAWSKANMSFEEVVAAGYRPGHRQAHRASALYRRIQAPPGAAGREAQRAQFRPRPPLSDHQRLSEREMSR